MFATNASEHEKKILELEQYLADCRKAHDTLATERAQFELFTNAISDHALVVLDTEGLVLRWNSGAERVTGWRSEDVVGENFSIFYTAEDVAAHAHEHEKEKAAQQGHSQDERWHLRRDGSRFWATGSLSAVRDREGALIGFIKVMQDMTERRRAQQLILESKERLRLFIENVTDYALLQVDNEGRISSWNTGAARAFGYKEDEIVGAPVRTLYLPDEAAGGDAERDLELALEKGRFEDARWLARQDGSRFFGRWVTTPMWDEAGSLRGYAKVLRDETERRGAEQQLQASLAEKNALLQEVNHRVKNNLQVITSLLSIQASRLQDSEICEILTDTANRIRAIGALHETLYSCQDLASIEFGSYVQSLVRNLTGFYAVDKNRIQVIVRTTDLAIEIGQAIPLGLVLNELVTNALKHAFPSSRNGSLTVELKYFANGGDADEDGSGQLSVTDDGVGLPPDVEFDRPPSMGFHLVNVLARQLHGELAVSGHPGTSVTIRFPLAGTPAGVSEYGANFAR